MNVYVTYENSMRTNVTGVYANKKSAIEAVEANYYMRHIDQFSLMGELENDNKIITKCKYFKQRLETIHAYISALYLIKGCEHGGIARIVVDEKNYTDFHINILLKIIDNATKRVEEIDIVRLICVELQKLSIQERALLFASYYPVNYCCNKCEDCPIEHGQCNFEKYMLKKY